MTKTRNTSLDLLKGIAALFVIWIHEKFPGVTGQLINRIGAFAVPRTAGGSDCRLRGGLVCFVG